MKTLKEIVPCVLQSLEDPEQQKRKKLMQQWESITGSKVAPHTRPSLSKTGKLFVWVDQAALACQLNQQYRTSLLRRVQAVLGEENVREIFFRVGQLR